MREGAQGEETKKMPVNSRANQHGEDARRKKGIIAKGGDDNCGAPRSEEIPSQEEKKVSG